MKKYVLICFILLTSQNVSALSPWDNILLRIFPKKLLVKAVRTENEETIKKCIGRVDFNSLDSKGLGLLHHMPQLQKPNSLHWLVKYGADINLQSQSGYEIGYTPLHYAAASGDLNLVKTLVNLGANIKAATRYGITPFNRANDYKTEEHIEICNYLKEKGAYNLLEAARCGDGEAVKKFLKSEDVDSTTAGGMTLLHMAAMKGHQEVAMLLLDFGASINSRTDKGETPIFMAIANNKTNIVQILATRGADLAVTLQDGSTLLHIAAIWGRLEIVKILVEAGIDLNVLDKDGDTAQELAEDLAILDEAFGERGNIANYLQRVNKRGEE